MTMMRKKEGGLKTRKEGWDMLLRDYEAKFRRVAATTRRRNMPIGIGHHLARSIKSHM